MSAGLGANAGKGGRLQGKIALVTGVGGGIGKACALRFAQEGATVVGVDIHAGNAQQTAHEAAERGLTIDVIAPCDLTKAAYVQRCMDAVGERHGRLDVLVNAAAIAPHMAPVATMDYAAQWTPTLAGEVDIVFLACKLAWPLLAKSAGASIINFASVNARRASTHFGMAAHCAGKAAVLALTRQLAAEGGPGIRANTISPGLVVTPATELVGATRGEVRERLEARMPMRRLGQPDDIAWCAVYLASDEAGWVTGADFAVDGGVMAV
jgi:NAD(P)-dependent dehydrogenase (short-subunit alcohol dehydrogenase family)